MDSSDFVNIESDLDLYEKGMELRAVFGTPVWEIVVATIKSYADGADRQVRAIPPGSPEVIPAQAALYALDQMYNNFIEDTQRAVEFANHPSEELLQYLSIMRSASDVRKSMDSAYGIETHRPSFGPEIRLHNISIPTNN